jgi:general secretion pathway protein L
MYQAFNRLLGLLSRLVSWWLGELWGLVPERLRARLAAPGDTLVLLLDDGPATLCLESGRELKPLGRIDRADPQPQQRLLAVLRQHGLARAMAGGRAAACLRLPAARAVRAHVDLPLAAEQNLAEVVSFELDRHTPFTAEQARFAYRIAERDHAARRLKLELTVVPRATIDEAVAAAARLHLDASRVDVADERTGAAASGNLLPRDASIGERGRGSVLTWGLGLTAAALAVVAVALPLRAAQQRHDALQRELAAVSAAAKSAAALQKEIDALRKDGGFLIDMKRARPTVSKLLFDTTHILPDDTSLAEWLLSGNEIQLKGAARSSSELVNLLEHSNRFRNTTFQSPVIQDQRTNKDRFHVSVQIVQGDGS